MSLESQSSNGGYDDSRNGSPFTFTASTNQIAHLADVFSSITSIHSQGLMIITSNGITLYSEYNHICNVQLTIDPSLFNTYNFYSESSQSSHRGVEELILGVDISLISDSFNAASSSIASKTKSKSGPNNGGATTNTTADNQICYITYNGEGHPLVIEFEDNLMSEKIEFLTFYLDIRYPYDNVNRQDADDDQYNLIINHTEVQFEVILKSDVFANLLKDLQQINTIDLFMYISNEMRSLGTNKKSARKQRGPLYMDNQLNFISKGPIGDLKLIYPNEKTILEKLSIYSRENGDEYSEMVPVNASLISCYNFSNFIKIFRAVKLSIKCKIMKDLSGILSIQLLCKNLQLPNYSGTLITFNMLETATIVDGFDLDEERQPQERLHLNNIFDDDLYSYVKEYNNKNVSGSIQNVQDINVNEYENLDNNDLHQPNKEHTTVPSLSYAYFNQNASKANNLQVNDTIYDAGNNRKNKRNRDNDEDEIGKKGTKSTNGVIEIPLFL